MKASRQKTSRLIDPRICYILNHLHHQHFFCILHGNNFQEIEHHIFPLKLVFIFQKVYYFFWRHNGSTLFVVLTWEESAIPLGLGSVSCIGLCWNRSIETSRHEKEFSTQDKNLTWKIKFLTSDENLNLRIKFSTWENLDFRKRPEIKGAFD